MLALQKVVMELVDMNSLGLFDIWILSVQVGFTLDIISLSYKIVTSMNK